MAFAAEALITAFDARQPFGIDATELTPAEDVLAEHFLPPYPTLSADYLDNCRANWLARGRLIDAIRGKYFFGEIVDVALQSLSEPAPLLLNSGRYRGKKPRDIKLFAASIVGFTVTANIASNNPDVTGTIVRHVWLQRRPLSTVRSDATLWGRYVDKDTGDNTILDVAARLARAAKHAPRGNKTFGPGR